MSERYVCGFVFDSPVGNVALIQKNRGPEDVLMAGHLNGLGGKLAFGETPRGAMSRTFRKEGGVHIPAEEWSCFHTERFIKTGNVVYYMTAKSMLFHTISTQTDERVILLPEYGAQLAQVVVEDETIPTLYNLAYLIPMAQSWLRRPDDRYFES